jgi:hypothetical protein
VDYSYAHACTTACESPLTTFATISNRSHPFLCNNEKGPQSGPFIVGRGGGIRTPGTFRFNGFQDRRDRPLCHSSVFLRKFVNFGLQMYGILGFSQTGDQDFLFRFARYALIKPLDSCVDLSSFGICRSQAATLSVSPPTTLLSTLPLHRYPSLYHSTRESEEITICQTRYRHLHFEKLF